VKLYVCYGTWTAGGAVHRHPCGEAHRAVLAAGYVPQVIRSYGLGLIPGAVNALTRGRRDVKELTGNYWVPLLVTDEGTAIQGSAKIIDWARTHPAASAAPKQPAAAPPDHR